MQMTHCPCGSGTLYADCCESVIKHQSAATALALMKSRYTAYCIGDVDYLHNTTQAKNRKQHNKTEIAQWSSENSWIKLEIICCENGTIHDTTGTVEFKAYFKDANGHQQVHHEKSNFCKENGRWFYCDGQCVPQKTLANTDTTRNSLCPCGSGKKYKKCCL